MSDDEALLRQAIALAVGAERVGELPYGSLLADADGRVLAREHNTTLSSGDITAHPELKLARWAAATLTGTQCADLTLYTSCEPCAMCANVIARAGLGRVVFALSNEQLVRLKPAGAVPPDLIRFRTEGPALYDEAARPVRRHYARIASSSTAPRPGA